MTIRPAIILSLVLFSGCSSTSNYTVDLSPLATGKIPTVESAMMYAEWTPIETGLDIKQQIVKVNQAEELFTIIRIDPAQHQLHLALDSDHPKTVHQWQTALPATVVVNGTYFDEAYQPTTQLILNQATYGPLLSGKTGFASTQDSNWSFSTTPPATALYSIQSYPLLINQSKPTVDTASANVAQRTILAKDAADQLYIIITEYGVLSLNQLDDIILTDLDLALTTALNLDGGPSTGLSIHSATVQYEAGSAIIPVVLYVD